MQFVAYYLSSFLAISLYGVLDQSVVHKQAVDLFAQLRFYNTPFVLGTSFPPVRSMA